jgi:hypothetical protein
MGPGEVDRDVPPTMQGALVKDGVCGSFERAPRPEEVQEHPAEQIERLEHPAFIARFGRSDQVDGICDRDTGELHNPEAIVEGKVSLEPRS